MSRMLLAISQRTDESFSGLAWIQAILPVNIVSSGRPLRLNFIPTIWFLIGSPG
jgi:hypothetical protein